MLRCPPPKEGTMAGKDMIVVRQEELRRVHVIRNVLENKMRQVKAAEVLCLSTRQIRRIVERIKAEGERGIVHRSRGRPSNRKMPDQIQSKAIELYRSKYCDFGPTLATEKLFERDGIGISDETLRRWLLQSGDWKPVRKRKKHRRWRERKPHLGEMVQMDGSHHAWFEQRAPECVLMSYIDDATGRAFGRFYDYEGTLPAMDSFRQYARRYGLPMKIYFDKHSTYKSTAKASIEQQLSNQEPLSQFERALKELGVEFMHAHSPQAKGRIERLFRTFQDRLVKEMRLRGINSIEEGNQFLMEYLPRYNRRFSVPPKEKGNLHRPLPKGLDLNTILCIKTERALRNDFTVAHNTKLYQIEEAVQASKLMIQDRIDGSMVVLHQGRRLKYKPIDQRPPKVELPKRSSLRRTKSYIPPADHPWRKFRITNRIPKRPNLLAIEWKAQR
jgi:transposase